MFFARSLSDWKVRCLIFSRKAECPCLVLLHFHFTGFLSETCGTSGITKQDIAPVYLYYTRFLAKRTRIVDLDISVPQYDGKSVFQYLSKK